MFAGNQPLSSGPSNLTIHCGADCCDYTKNKTRKNIKISEKYQYQKDVFMCVLHHYEKRVTHRETRV